MATLKGKDATLRKEKVSSPSSGSAKASSDKSTSSGRPTPSYLRPTLSSRLEITKPAKKLSNEDKPPKKTSNEDKLVKKSNNEDTAAQKKMLRRRSFDKPSSPTPSLVPRPRSRDKTLGTMKSLSFQSRSSAKPGLEIARSSSFQSRSVVKPGSETNSMSSRSGKTQVPTARATVRRTSSLSKSSGPLLTKTVKKGPVSQIPSPSPPTHFDLDTERKEPSETGDLLVHESDGSANVDNESHASKETLESVEATADALQELKPISDAEPFMDETEIKLPEEETQKAEENHPEEVIVVVAKVDEVIQPVEAIEDKEEENVTVTTTAVDEPIDEKIQEEVEGQAVIGSDEGIKPQDDQVRPQEDEAKPPEEQDLMGKVQQEKVEAPNNVTPKRPAEKKESPGAYNDVIEETKNKLLEARKNRVKALVGAFETVIDYESK